MPNILTLYFAGSGHGLEHNDDSMVVAYKKTVGPKMFFPGPGGKDNTIYRMGFIDTTNMFSDDKIVRTNTTGSGIDQKRSATGKGWNRNVWYALEAIADYVEVNEGAAVSLNFAGHSRGSITIIMLLNDLFHEHVPPMKRRNYTVASTVKGTKTFKGPQNEFGDWYENRLQKLFAKRMGSNEDAELGLEYLKRIASEKHRLRINVFLFDPVGGLNQGDSSRKQEFPGHIQEIKRVRILRMEQGGAGGTLSTNMPVFAKSDNWTFLSGVFPRSLSHYGASERLVIPLPGTHGAGLSFNEYDHKLNRYASELQRYIGTSYMVGLLSACGTRFENGFVDRYNDPRTMKSCYDQLYEEFVNVAPGTDDNGWGVDRSRIHKHHTGFTTFMGKKKVFVGRYAGNAVNSHHRYLKEHVRN